MINNNDLRDMSPNKNFWILLRRWLWVIVVLVVSVTLLGWAFAWFSVPFERTDPDLIRRLSQDANEAYTGLLAQQASITNIENRMIFIEQQYGNDRSRWPQGKADEYLQLVQQRQNLINAYNQACGEYLALWNDEWRDIPAPDDLPKTCEMR